MKTLTFIIIALATSGSVCAQSWTNTFSANYGFALPTGGMKPYVRNGHALNINVLFEAPSKRVATGLELSFTGYGHSKREMDYTFPDGTWAPMNLVITNSILSAMAMTRLYLVLDGPVRPYATFRAGYTHFGTRLNIVDPNDGDSCEPVESSLLSRDGTFAYGAGGGVRIDIAWLAKNVERGKYFIDFSSNMLQGGRVSYMNEDAPEPNMNHRSTTRAKEVEAQFINTQTQVVHAHHVGYLYNSFVQMMDFRLGVSVNLKP